MIKANLFEMGIALLMVGCPEASALFEPADLNDPITLKKIIAEATDAKSLQKRGEKGKELYYSPNEQTLYTGWGKEMHDNGRIKSLIQVKEGKMRGLINAWHKNGQKTRESNFKDDKEDGVVREWYENGQKQLESNWKDGKPDGLFISYNEDGSENTRQRFKDGEEVD